MKIILLLLLVVAPLSANGKDLYRCESGGSTVYTDQPCMGGRVIWAPPMSEREKADAARARVRLQDDLERERHAREAAEQYRAALAIEQAKQRAQALARKNAEAQRRVEIEGAAQRAVARSMRGSARRMPPTVVDSNGDAWTVNKGGKTAFNPWTGDTCPVSGGVLVECN